MSHSPLSPSLQRWGALIAPPTNHVTFQLALCMGRVLTTACPRGIRAVTGSPQAHLCYLRHFMLLEESQSSGKFLKCGVSLV